MQKDRINLLMVDDELEFLQSMAKRLTVRGFNVIAVDRGAKAIEAARNHAIDIAVVDLKMPGLDGDETIQALLKEHMFLEVVILTGHGSFQSAEQFTQKGVFHYAQKPCDLDRLLILLTEAFKRRVMKRMNIDRKEMEKLLKPVEGGSTMAILEKIRELDRA